MIYALRGMVSDTPEGKLLVVDYQKDIKQLIRDTVLILLFPENVDNLRFDYVDWD